MERNSILGNKQKKITHRYKNCSVRYFLNRTDYFYTDYTPTVMLFYSSTALIKSKFHVGFVITKLENKENYRK
jgi:hypothetical protein